MTVPVTDKSVISVEVVQAAASNALGEFVLFYEDDGCGFLADQKVWGAAMGNWNVVGGTLNCLQVPKNFTFGAFTMLMV